MLGSRDPSFISPQEYIIEVSYASQNGEARQLFGTLGDVISIEIHQESQFGIEDLIIQGEVLEYTKEIKEGNVRETLWILMNDNIRVVNSEHSETEYHHVKKSRIDEKYPHICFNCKRELRFEEMCAVNTNKDKDHLKKLWKLEEIEFYCCSCFKNANSIRISSL